MISKLMNENSENVKEAIENGISGEAVEATLEDMINKSDGLSKTPSQIKDAVETIVDMKELENTKTNEAYASNFVKNNSEKIESALNDGISAKEITDTLVKETNEKERKRLPFIVKLISKMKKKELKLNKENTKGYQKVKVKS